MSGPANAGPPNEEAVEHSRPSRAEETTERAYGHYARIYDLLFDRLLQPGRRAAVAALAPAAGDRVLEIGIGTGLSVPLYPTGCRITGIDLSREMLQEAEKKRPTAYPAHDLRLLRMDATSLEFPDDAFDRVLASYVLSTVPEPDRTLAEILRVCRPGGRVVILNHFRSGFPPFAVLERLLSPLTWHLGFRLDLPRETVTRSAGLELVGSRGVNVLRLWTLLVATVREPPSAGRT